MPAIEENISGAPFPKARNVTPYSKLISFLFDTLK
jgi:hypothetical protein